MNSPAKSRRFRPSIDRMEPICLLSGGIHGAAVHALTVVDLKPTQIGADAIQAISNSTPHGSRQKIVLSKLTADSSTNTISGLASETYKVPIIGTITVTVQFKTNIDTPKPGDVKVSLSKFGAFFSSSKKLTVQKGVVSFLKHDHDQIVALLKPQV